MLSFTPIFVLQDGLDIKKPSFHRTYRPRELDRYAVSVDSDGTAGSAHYDYELAFLAERPVAETTDTRVDVTFRDLRGNLGDFKLPPKKLFGNAVYQFPETGLPADLSLGGTVGSFVVPILSWYLPIEGVAVGEGFKVSDLVIDGPFHLAGVGKLRSNDHGRATIELTLSFFTSDPLSKSLTDAKAKFTSVSTFETKSGQMLESEGRLDGFGGSTSFKVHRK